jgi:hypothetical protein
VSPRLRVENNAQEFWIFFNAEARRREGAELEFSSIQLVRKQQEYFEYKKIKGDFVG